MGFLNWQFVYVMIMKGSFCALLFCQLRLRCTPSTHQWLKGQEGILVRSDCVERSAGYVTLQNGLKALEGQNFRYHQIQQFFGQFSRKILIKKQDLYSFAMSFRDDQNLEDTGQAIDEAIDKYNDEHPNAKLAPKRVDKQKGASYEIPARVFNEIDQSRLVIADLPTPYTCCVECSGKRSQTLSRDFSYFWKSFVMAGQLVCMASCAALARNPDRVKW